MKSSGSSYVRPERNNAHKCGRITMKRKTKVKAGAAAGGDWMGAIGSGLSFSQSMMGGGGGEG